WLEEAVKAEEQVEVAEEGPMIAVPGEGVDRVLMPALLVEPPHPRREDLLDAEAHQLEVPSAALGLLERGLALPEAGYVVGREEPLAVELIAPRGELRPIEIGGEVPLDAAGELLLRGGVPVVEVARAARAPAVREEAERGEEEEKGEE